MNTLEFLSMESLQALINDNAIETQQLEFKNYQFPSGKIDGKNKDDLAKEITAFANAEGGYIIIGIDEDGKRMASKIVDTGCKRSEFDELQMSIQSMLLAKVRPRLYGVTMNPIDLDTEKIAVVINVPKSYNRPHAVNDGNKDNFYIRHSNGVTFMSIDDLRRQFVFTASRKNELKQFRQERIGMILNNECIGNLAGGAKVLVHIIPLWSFEEGNNVNIQLLQQEEYTINAVPISGGAWDYRFNSDGFCLTHVNYETKEIDTYSQIFRNGIVESVDIRMMNFNQQFQKQVYDWRITEGAVYEALIRYSDMLKKLQVPKPWYIYISFLNAKGFRTDSFYGGTSESIERDIVHATECVWEDDSNPLDKVIRPTFDSLANCFGKAYSPNFDKEGYYHIRKG